MINKAKDLFHFKWKCLMHLLTNQFYQFISFNDGGCRKAAFHWYRIKWSNLNVYLSLISWSEVTTVWWGKLPEISWGRNRDKNQTQKKKKKPPSACESTTRTSGRSMKACNVLWRHIKIRKSFFCTNKYLKPSWLWNWYWSFLTG